MKKQKGRTSPDGIAGDMDRNDHFGQWAFLHEGAPCGMKSLRSDTLTMRVTGVRITAFSSAIVIDVIVHCHTAGTFGVKRQKTIVLIIVWLGFDPFRPVQNHIGSGAGNPARCYVRFGPRRRSSRLDILNCCYYFSSSTYGGDWSLCVDGTCIIAVPAQCAGL